MRIRKMKKEDLKTLFKLGKKHWKEDEWLTMSYLENSFNQKGLCYTAEDNGRIVGGIIMVFEDIVKNWIRYIVIDKDYRRGGIGSRLLKKVSGHLRSGESVFVDTGKADKIAIKFYEKNNFKNRGKVNSLYENCPGYIFEKVI